MNIHDGVGLFQKIMDNGLADKCLRDFSFGDLKLLADLLAEHCDGTTIPVYDQDKKRLIIGFNAPFKYRYWLHNYGDAEKYRLFREMGVPESEMHKYLHQAQIEAGREKNKKSG